MTNIIEYKRVELHRNAVVVLKNINIDIRQGELVYLIGKVGSGKSTFLKSIYHEIPIAAGQARVFDYDLVNIRNREIPYLRRDIGIVFQDFRLLNDRSVYDNLLFVLNATGWKDKHTKEQRIEQVLKEMGMANKSYKMPHELSGGEQQRIVMARAMLNRPKLILADEPTGNSDPDTAFQIMKRFTEIAATGTTVIVATHNMSLPEQFPGRIIQCADKHLTEISPLQVVEETETDLELELDSPVIE